MHDMSMMTDADLKVSPSTSCNCNDMLQMVCFPLYLGLVEGKLKEVVMRYGGHLDSSLYIIRVHKKE